MNSQQSAQRAELFINDCGSSGNKLNIDGTYHQNEINKCIMDNLPDMKLLFRIGKPCGVISPGDNVRRRGGVVKS